MENTKKLGNLTELQCMTYLYGLGYSVSIPFGNADKYDLILDINDRLYKVQIKHSSEYKDELGETEYIKFKCTWQSHNTSGYTRTQYKENEIDFFATFYEGKCYLVPQSQCSNEKVLRIKPLKNNQRKGISFLEDYVAETIISKL